MSDRGVARSPYGENPGKAQLPWRLADIPYAQIEVSEVTRTSAMFELVTLASFVETGSDLYAQNLVSYFDDDDEISAWLATSWEQEELQHGAALRRYVEHAWPWFDWQSSYDEFFAEYSRTCTLPDLEPARGLELAARCVVEMGTATLYSALNAYADEPVLKQLTRRIYADEVRHYKHFYCYFRRYQGSERHGRLRVGRTLAKRLLATRDEDGFIAYRHLWNATGSNAGIACDEAYQAFRARVNELARRHAPRDLPVQMLIKPLDLPLPVSRAARAFAGSLYRYWLS
jgi:hypothetical protein